MTDIASLEINVKSKGIDKATKKLQKLERQGEKTQKSAKGTGKSFFTMAKGLTVAAVGVTALSAVLIKATLEVMDFSQELANLSAITGATGKDLDFYAKSAKEIGRTTTLSAKQAVTAFKLIASAKPDLLQNAKALQEVTKSAVTLAEASGIDLPSAAKALGSALNQFGLDASKANEVINTLAASSKLGAAEIPAVTEALKNSGSAANALGVDLVETVAGIQALAIAGREGSEAGTGLRQVLLKLEKTGRTDLMPSLNGLSASLENLKRKQLDNTQLMKLFGDEGFSAATALLEQSDNVAKLSKELRGTETAFEQAAVRMNTLSNDVNRLKSSFSNLLISIGEKLEPFLRKATKAFTELIDVMTDFFFGELSLKELEEDLIIVRKQRAELDSAETGRGGAKARELSRKIKLLEREILARKELNKLNGKTTGLEITIESKKIKKLGLDSKSPHAKESAFTRSLVSENLIINESMLNTISIFEQFEDSVKSWGDTFAEEMINGSGSFKNFANTILTQMAKMAMANATQPIFDAVFAGLTNGSGNSNQFNNNGVGIVPSLNGGGFTGTGARVGGVDGIGGFPAILHPNETVIDHTKGQTMGNVVVNVDASGTSTKGDSQKLGNMIGVAVRSILIEESRQGGLLA